MLVTPGWCWRCTILGGLCEWWHGTWSAKSGVPYLGQAIMRGRKPLHLGIGHVREAYTRARQALRHFLSTEALLLRRGSG